jgi:hypothetical protein
MQQNLEPYYFKTKYMGFKKNCTLVVIELQS